MTEKVLKWTVAVGRKADALPIFVTFFLRSHQEHWWTDIAALFRENGGCRNGKRLRKVVKVTGVFE